MTVSKALSDPSRVRILSLLIDHELCVCQITELLGLAPSTISRHLSLLQGAELIQSRKLERWIYYRAVTRQAGDTVRRAIAWVKNSLGEDETILRDRENLVRLLLIPLEEICRGQRAE